MKSRKSERERNLDPDINEALDKIDVLQSSNDQLESENNLLEAENRALKKKQREMNSMSSARKMRGQSFLNDQEFIEADADVWIKGNPVINKK